MAGISLTDILTQVGNASKAMDTGTAKIEGFLQEAAALTGNSKDLMTQAAADQALVAQTQQAALLSTQTARQKLGLEFGTDANAVTEVYSLLSGIEKENWKLQQEAKASIDRKSGISLMEDPIGFITAKLTINEDIEKHNAANQNRQAALARIEDLNKVTSSSAILQAQFANATTVASAEAAARLASTQARVQANQLSLEGLQFNVQGVKEALGATKEKLGFLFNAKSAQNADAQLALAQASSAREAARFKLQMEQKLKEDKYDSSILDSINAGRAVRGLPALAGVKADSALIALKSKSPIGVEFEQDWSTGERLLATGKAVLASSPAEMLTRLSSGQVIAVSPSQELVKQKLVSGLEMAKASKAWDPKDVAASTKVLNAAAQAVVMNDAREVKPGDVQNLFALPPLNQIVKNSVAASEAPVYTKLLKPLMESGMQMENPETVIAVTVKGIKEGKISYNDALTLTTMYQAASNARIAEIDLPKFGLQPVYSYNVRIQNPGKLMGSDIVDMTKPDMVGRLLNQRLVNESIPAQLLKSMQTATLLSGGKVFNP